MRILIAEDDQVLADGLLRTLRASGAAVDHVAKAAFLESEGPFGVDKFRYFDQSLAREYAQAIAFEIKVYWRGTRGHLQVLAAGEIEFFAGDGSIVVFDADVRHRKLEVFGIKTIHGHGVGMCFQ